MSSLTVTVIVMWYLRYLLGDYVNADEFDDENGSYEFSFNIVNFQHRHEKKDADGIITGEYGFITADGVYHETAYATDKDGDFKITRMKNRKITSLRDAKTLFKDKPEVARKLTDALLKSCSSCKIPKRKGDEKSVIKMREPNISKLSLIGPSERNMENILREMAKALINENTGKLSILSKATSSSQNTEKEKTKKNEATSKYLKVIPADENPSTLKTSPVVPEMLKKMTDAVKRILSNEVPESTRTGKALVTDKVLEKMANDLYYHFNYTITSHGHHEDGHRNGSKDGGYNTVDDNGVDIQVKYLSNEFGHQPNITLVPRPTSGIAEKEELKGYSFVWY